ncbi:hypothetical protein COLO4_19027 [Corchorus olitorius]|uniref:F-box domain-containing protein n=1 Tax=Corchorus olitorius TaxID=93759 RepID=A0A1R3J712_9ROSI|nr:hypothetical protein COLO4_19027 [Corchorus olitorius]
MPSRINLPHDIVMEILCRLAGKDVVRFRCLSKDCRDLIDSPDFVKLQLKHNSHRFLILRGVVESAYHYKVNDYSLDLASLENNAQINITELLDLQSNIPLGSCNGLIALKTSDGDSVVICNPTTRKIRIPVHMDPVSDDLPTRRNYGFGYDPVSDDYKLVMMHEKNVEVLSTSIYSLKAGIWRSCFQKNPCFPSDPTLLFQRRAILANNALHWMLRDKISPSIGLVVAFDLTSERYRCVSLPLLVKGKRLYHQINIKELGGCLCMIGRRYHTCYDNYVDIWVMEEYGVRESWTKLSTLSMSGFLSIESVAYSKCGQKLLLCVYEDFKIKLIWHNLLKIDQNMEILVLPDRFYTSGIDVCCVSSLVSPIYDCSNELQA